MNNSPGSDTNMAYKSISNSEESPSDHEDSSWDFEPDSENSDNQEEIESSEQLYSDYGI